MNSKNKKRNFRVLALSIMLSALFIFGASGSSHALVVSDYLYNPYGNLHINDSLEVASDIIMYGRIYNPSGSVAIDDDFEVAGTGIFDSIKVGKQGVGGVTFFNGTIVNTTTDSEGAGIPVTFGDDVMIDGSLWRNAGDFQIKDNLKIEGDVYPTKDMTYDLGKSKNRWKTVYADKIVGRELNISGIGIVDCTSFDEWNEAYSWGDHSVAGYLSSYTETDPVWSAAKSNYANLSQSELIVGNWVNTNNPWVDNEVSDSITIANTGSVDIGALNITSQAQGDIAYMNLTGWSRLPAGTSGQFLMTRGSGVNPTWSSEVDPIFSFHAASTITGTNIIDWSAAYGWGDHSVAGYQAQSVYLNDLAAITPAQGDIIYFDGTNWQNLAPGTSGQYLQTHGPGADPHWTSSGTVESDPIWGASPSAGILGGDITNWNTAFGWGDHSTAGYLSVETDPVFGASAASSITNSGSGLVVTNTERAVWNTAFGWGDHSVAGYQSQSAYLDDITAITAAKGDMLYFDGANWQNLAPGTSGHFLQTQGAGNDPQWASSAGAELDPIFVASAANSITNAGSGLVVTNTERSNWNTAYGWGDHSVPGYITASSVNALTNKSGNISMWTNDSGYVTTSDDTVSGTELDGVFSTTGLLQRTGVGTYSTITNNSANWDTAFGWGNHASAGYLTSYTETDPIFVASAANSITNAGSGLVVTNTERTNWNTAFGWGDHSVPGYITASSTDTLTNKSGNVSMWTNDSGYLTSYTETDPIWVATEPNYGHLNQAEIVLADWDNTANPWALNEIVSTVMAQGENISLLNNDSGYVATSDDTVSGIELDGVFSTTGLLQRTGAGIYNTITNDSSNWNTAYGWNDHSLAGYLTVYNETDPIFGVHAAATIAGTDITNWNNAFGWGDHASAGYLSQVLADTFIFVGNGSSVATGVAMSGDATIANTGALTIADNSIDGTDIALGSDAQGDVMYYNGTDWVRLAAGTSGQYLQTNGVGANPTWTAASVTSEYGELYLTSAGTLYALDQDVWKLLDNLTASVSSSGVTLGAAGGTMTIGASAGGTYEIEAEISGLFRNDREFSLGIFNNGTEVSRCTQLSEYAGNVSHTLVAGCYVDLSAADVLTLKVYNSDGGEDITVSHLNFRLNKIN